MRIDRRVVVPVLAALSVTALGVSVALLGDDPDREPRTLQLSASRSAADAAMGAPTTESGYVLVGTLPSGRPDDAPAWTLPDGPADATTVQRLARALEAGLPTREGASWRAGGLSVQDTAGQPWWWTPCPDGTVSSDGRTSCDTPGVSGGGSAGSSDGSAGSGSGDGVDGSDPDSGVVTPAPPAETPVPAPAPTGTAVPEPRTTGVPEPTGSPVPEQTVTAAARPVLEALGLSLDDARVETTPYGGSVTVPASVDGVEAHGFVTRLDVMADGTLSNGSGWLADPQRGDTYPLITAQQAFDRLPPRMVAMLCPIGPDGKGCTPPPPTEVTGARLGLSVQPLRDGGQVLVPSWLFTVKDSPELLPAVAVDPAYLDTGDDTPVPGDDPVPPPASGTPGQTDPGAARESFSFDAYWPGDTAGTIVVRYGDSSSCVHEDVTHAVKETPEAVYVVLEADGRDPGLACTDDYRAVERVIRLEAPLGDRQVFDGASGKPVPAEVAR